MKLKRLLTLLILTVLMLIPTSAFAHDKQADTTWTPEDFTYEEMDATTSTQKVFPMNDSQKTLSGKLYMITGLSESGLEKVQTNRDLVIPAKDPDGRKVEGIKSNAFSAATGYDMASTPLDSVKLPDGIYDTDNILNGNLWADYATHNLSRRGGFVIGNSAFKKNNIKELVIPEGVLFVEISAFQQNPLESVVLPSTLMTVNNQSFAQTSGKLKQIIFPAKTDFKFSVMNMVFFQHGATTVSLPETIQIGGLATNQPPFRNSAGTLTTLNLYNLTSVPSLILENVYQKPELKGTRTIVTFDGNGGYTPAPGNEYVNDGGTLDYLPTPEAKECGVKFDGWYTAAEGGTKVNIDRIYTADTTIYAHWTEAPALEKVEATDSDCTNKGNIEHYKCKTCGKLFSDDKETKELTKEEVEIDIDADAHDWDDGTVTTKPTLTKDGEKTYTCKINSGHTRKEAIPKLVDVLTVKVVDENEEPVEGLQLIADCGDDFEEPEEFLEPTNKDGVAELDISVPQYMSSVDEDYEITFEEECWEVTQPVTFVFQINSNPFYYYIEKVNGDYYDGSEVVLKLKRNHDTTKTEAKEATCAEEGNIEYYTCSKCKKLFKDEAGTEETTADEVKLAIDPDAHDFSDGWKELDASTHQRVCKHDASHVEKEAHKWDGGKVTKKATTSATGVKTYTCTVCSATKTESIPKLKSTAKKVLVAKGIANDKTASTISWNDVGADRYVIYLSRCNHDGKKVKLKKVKTVNGKTLKWKKTKLLKNKAYKFKVVAQKKSNGKYKTLATSKEGHFITGNVMGKVTNPKSITLKKSAFTLKKGKTATIKATVTKVKSGKKLGTNHAKMLRFTSNNPSVATVSAGGKITAKSPGTAKIYVQTINGIWKVVKVTVK